MVLTEINPSPESARRRKTRQLFLLAFLRLIAVRPIDKITVTDIANEANYGRWAFYQYFQSKEEVAYAAFVLWMNELDARVVAAVKDRDSPQREYASWRMLFHAFDQQRVFFKHVTQLTGSVWYGQIKEFLVRQFLQHLHDGNFSLMPGVRPEIAARLYVAAVMELLELWASSPDSGDVDTLVDEFFIFIFKQPPPK